MCVCVGGGGGGGGGDQTVNLRLGNNVLAILPHLFQGFFFFFFFFFFFYMKILNSFFPTRGATF